MNELINQYENKLFAVELSAQNIEMLISCINTAIKQLKYSKPTKLKEIKLGELSTLKNYLESF